MQISIPASVLYFGATMALILGVYQIKKSEKRLYGITWGAISIIAVTCFQVFTASILNLIHIPVNIISIGIFNLLPAVWMWYRIIKKQEKQKYQYDWSDAAMMLLLAAVVGMFAYQRYGFTLDIHYLTIDPAAHLKSAMDVVNGQRVDSMFYASLNNALGIELLGIFAGTGAYYKIFVLEDILHLFLAGWMFWGAIRRYCRDNFLKIAGIIMTIIYLLAYPLNSTIFGFVYLGMGVTIIACLITLTDEFIREALNKWFNIVLISLGCLGIFECYVLFMPVTYFAILACVLVKQYQKKLLFSMDTVITGLSIFLVPCIIGLLYTYLGIFGGETTVGSAIANEGAIYRDLYSNFVFIMPLAMYGYWSMLKEKKNRLLSFITPFLLIFIFSLFLKGMMGQVSSYYFYKNYYFLWCLVFILAVQGIAHIEKNTRGFLVCCFGMWLFVAGMFEFQMESRIQNKNSLYSVSAKAASYLDIYSFNNDGLRVPKYPGEKILLYQYALSELLEKQDEEVVPLAGYWEDSYWMEAITSQRMNGFDYWNIGDELFFENLEERAEYVIVLTDSEFYAAYQEYFDSMERIYENAYGFIGKVNDGE